MKRRFGMWIGILCILIVGVSVTRMTKDFVVSKGVAASSILHIADTENFSAAPAGGAMADSVAKKEIKISIPADSGAESMEADEEAAPMEQASVTSSETAPASGSYGPGTASLAGQTAGPGAPAVENGAYQDGMAGSFMDSDTAVEEAVEEEEAEVSEMAAEAEIQSATAPGNVVENMAAEAPSAKIGPSAEEAIQETVKSPLDPVVETKPALIEEETEKSSIMADDFLGRFANAETASAELWEKVSAENVVAYNATAEQERVLWDYELNLVYGAIRERMSKEEAESLKYLELEWLKERDQYAEKMAAKSPMMNAQKQNPAYTRALTEKTKERCYWLVSEYDEILNRPNEDESNKIGKKP